MNTQPSDLLRQAALLIEQAAQQLDTSARACTCCGSVRYVDITQARVSEQIINTPHKLRQCAARLDNAGTTGTTGKGDQSAETV